jgi:hypothetical protein
MKYFKLVTLCELISFNSSHTPINKIWEHQSG